MSVTASTIALQFENSCSLTFKKTTLYLIAFIAPFKLYFIGFTCLLRIVCAQSQSCTHHRFNKKSPVPHRITRGSFGGIKVAYTIVDRRF